MAMAKQAQNVEQSNQDVVTEQKPKQPEQTGDKPSEKPAPTVELKGRKDPQEVVSGVKNKSEAIRALHAANFTPSEIVRLSKDLEILQYKDPNGDRRMIRYQHVRNILNQPLAKKA